MNSNGENVSRVKFFDPSRGEGYIGSNFLVNVGRALILFYPWVRNVTQAMASNARRTREFFENSSQSWMISGVSEFVFLLSSSKFYYWNNFKKSIQNYGNLHTYQLNQ